MKKWAIGVCAYLLCATLSYGTIMGDEEYYHVCGPDAYSMALVGGTLPPVWIFSLYTAAGHKLADGYVPFAWSCE